jgi:DUF4097 and DUF4098 domain-containing protein YvlB
MTVTVNGQTIEVPDGSSVSVSDRKVVVNGQVRFATGAGEQVRVEITGPCGPVTAGAGDVTVTGHVAGSVKTGAGDVKCGPVTGNIETSAGDVTVTGGVGGFVRTTAGDVHCGDVAGDVTTTAGDIIRRK